MIKLTFDEIKTELERILLKVGFDKEKSAVISNIFAENNLLGKDSHGLNRFPAFIESINKKLVDVNASPELINSFQALEQWDGKLGAGPVNASFAADRSIKLAEKFGIGCVALKNTNHWMRGGSYGWFVAQAGYILISWTNATPLMPAWGSMEAKLGNNPLVIAIPHGNQPIVLDMALSQYSYGALEVMSRRKMNLEHEGGFDSEGNLTKNPDEILKSKRPLPIGLWKGAGLSIVFDILATILSGGNSTHEIGKQGAEYGVSQIFISINPNKFLNKEEVEKIINEIVDDFHSSAKIDGQKILYPGEQSAINKKLNKVNGISVDEEIREQVKKL